MCELQLWLKFGELFTASCADPGGVNQYYYRCFLELKDGAMVPIINCVFVTKHFLNFKNELVAKALKVKPLTCNKTVFSGGFLRLMF